MKKLYKICWVAIKSFYYATCLFVIKDIYTIICKCFRKLKRLFGDKSK